MNLLDFWIMLNETGIIIYRKVKDPLMKDGCFGRFMSAFTSITTELFTTPFGSFSIKDFSFYLLRKHKITFIGKFPEQLEKNTGLEELRKIADKFFQNFSRNLFEDDKWDCNTSRFIIFDPIIDNPI